MTAHYKTAKLVLSDYVTFVMYGVDHCDATYIDNTFKIRPEGYAFKRSYKLNLWDGFIHYFKVFEGGLLGYQVLLEQAVKILSERGYKFQVVDKRPTVQEVHTKEIDQNIFSDIIHPKTNKPLILRDYQVQAVNKLLQNRIGIIEAATGAGKTTITAALSKVYLESDLVPAITIVPDKTLVAQTADYYKHLGLDVGIIGGGLYEPDHPIIVSTWQSLRKRENVVKQAKAVILDECHKGTAKEIRKILLQHGKHIAHRVGVTGSMPRDPSLALLLRASLGPVVFKISPRYLIDKKILADVSINIIQLIEDLSEEYADYVNQYVEVTGHPPDKTMAQFKNEMFDDYTSEKRYLSKNKKRIQWIYEFIKTIQQQSGSCLVLTQTINVAKEIADSVPEGTGYFVSSRLSSSKRQELFDLVTHDNNVVLTATSQLASTGVDIPEVKNIILVDIAKSYTRIVQSIGRGLRKTKNKSKVTVYDICSDLKFSNKHLQERTRVYDTHGFPYKISKIDYNKDLKRINLNKILEEQ